MIFHKKEEYKFMKFKNSYILLIAIAIFLLVSIGSVCASNNVTDNDSIASADAEVDLVDGDILSNATQEKITTNITAKSEKGKFSYDEEKNITVAVNDNESHAISNIDKNNLTVLEGNQSINFKYNNSIITILDKLSVGNHSLTINYLGNDAYTNSSVPLLLKVYGNYTIETDDTVYSDCKNLIIPVKISDGVEYIKLNETKLKVTYINEIGEVTELSFSSYGNDRIICNVEDILKFVQAGITLNYSDAAESRSLRVLLNTTVNVTAKSEYLSDEDKTMEVKVFDGQGNVLNVAKTDLAVIENGKELEFTYDSSIIAIPSISGGVHTIIVAYKGNETYALSNKTVTLTVDGINVTSSIDINSTKEGIVKINIIGGNGTTIIKKEDLTLSVTCNDNNKTRTIDITSYRVENGILYFTLKDGNFTKATLNIKYNKTEANVTLNRIYNINIIPINTVADYQGDDFTFQIVDIDDNNAPVINKTIEMTAKNSTGTAIVFTTISPEGGYSMGPTLKVVTNASGIVVLENKNFYPGYVFSSLLYPPADTYTFSIKGSDQLKGSNTTNITINKVNVTITLEKFEEYYGTSKKVTIVVTNPKSGKPLSGVNIVLSISDLSLSNANQQTNENGTIYLSVENVPTGTYTIGYATNTTSLNNYTGSGTFTIKKIPVKITAKNVKIYYNTGNTYTIKVTKSGKAVKGMYVVVRIYHTSKKYQNYMFQTTKKGKITFKASLAAGSHKIIITSVDTRYSTKQITKKITVKKAKGKLTAKKVTAYYKSGKYLTVKLTNTKKKKPIYDAKVKINNYNYRTDMNGKIKLSFGSLKPGKYQIVVSPGESKNYTAKKITTQIVIKKTTAKLIPKKLTAKKGAKKYFKVTVKNKKTKKAVQKVKIKIKVYTGKKAKSYSVKTSTKGIAKLNTAKLKAGKHKVVVASADKYCTAKKAKSNIIIKK